MAGPMTASSQSQMVTISQPFVVEAADVGHAAAVDADDGDAQCVVRRNRRASGFGSSAAKMSSELNAAMAADMTAEFWRNSLRLKGPMLSSRIVMERW